MQLLTERRITRRGWPDGGSRSEMKSSDLEALTSSCLSDIQVWKSGLKMSVSKQKTYKAIGPTEITQKKSIEKSKDQALEAF